MIEPELFGVPVVKSPRLLWLEKHRVKVAHTEFKRGDEDDQGNDLWPCYAWSGYETWADVPGHKLGFGEAEDDALAVWARNNGKRMWFEEGAA